MDSNEGVLLCVANYEVGKAIITYVYLLPSAPTLFLLARNDITVCATWHASVQGHIQVPEVRAQNVVKASQCHSKAVDSGSYFALFSIKQNEVGWLKSKRMFIAPSVRKLLVLGFFLEKEKVFKTKSVDKIVKSN